MSATRRAFCRVKPPLSLKPSVSGRYLVDGHSGQPFRIHADAGWYGLTALTLAEWRTYLDARKALGFNGVLLQLTNALAPSCPAAGSALCFSKNASGGTWDGDAGFVSDQGAHSGTNGGAYHFDAAVDFPNDAYFDTAKQFIDEAAYRNLLAILAGHYFGINANTSAAFHDGWGQTSASAYNTQARHLAYGQYLGSKFASCPNIVWDMGVDTGVPIGSELSARLHKIVEGVKSSGSKQPWFGHWSVADGMTIGSDQTDFADVFNVQGVYTHGPYGSPNIGPTYGNVRRGYTANVGPVVLAETTYEGEHSITPAQLRDLHWWAALSGAIGQIFGNAAIWPFAGGWPSSLNTTGAQDFCRLDSFLAALPWSTLVPSGLGGSSTIVTAGGGTFTTITGGNSNENGGMDWVASARTPDGKLILAYVPSAHSGTVTIDMTLLSGTADATDYDPSSGGSSSLGSFSASGTHAFTITAGHLLMLQVP